MAKTAVLFVLFITALEGDLVGASFKPKGALELVFKDIVNQ